MRNHCFLPLVWNRFNVKKFVRFSLIHCALNPHSTIRWCIGFQCCWHCAVLTSGDCVRSRNCGSSLHRRCAIASSIASSFQGKRFSHIRQNSMKQQRKQPKQNKVKICVYLDSLMWFFNKTEVKLVSYFFILFSYYYYYFVAYLL